MTIPIEDLIRVRIIALLEEPEMNSPVVILHDPDSNRVLPIWIGAAEARAIAMGLQDVEISRPLTHTLISNMVDELDGIIQHVVIERIDAGTYYAMIALVDKDGKLHEIDARPSDSIALALELEIPIFITSEVLNAAGQDNPFPAEVVADKENDEKLRQAFLANAPKAKSDFSDNELLDLKILLEKARKREETTGGE
jgi:uncharacterized protein